MDGRRGRRTGHVGPFRADGGGEVPCAGGGRGWGREELVARCPRVMEEGRAEGSVLGGRGDEREGCGGVWVLVGTLFSSVLLAVLLPLPLVLVLLLLVLVLIVYMCLNLLLVLRLLIPFPYRFPRAYHVHIVPLRPSSWKRKTVKLC